MKYSVMVRAGVYISCGEHGLNSFERGVGLTVVMEPAETNDAAACVSDAESDVTIA